MTRKLRRIYPNSYHHVSIRTNNKIRIFENKEVCNLYLANLRNEKLKNHFKVYSFCLMPTHPHLMLETNDKIASLQKVMHGLNMSFTKKYHELFSTSGRIWKERYSGRSLTSDAEIGQIIKYIADNPVEANIVSHACDYFYNSINNLKTKDFNYVLDKIPSKFQEMIIKEYF